jgi:hypothetical protein
MAGVHLSNFEEKGRKISKLNILTCCQVPASLFYLKILKEKEENVQAIYFHMLPGSSKSFLPSNFEVKKEEKCPSKIFLPAVRSQQVFSTFKF